MHQKHTRFLAGSRRASWLLLLTVICSGCGSPGKYHFFHYHRPFKAIAESSKTYFHSSQTGRIIEKDPCATYCEPGCFGYEPTCWTPWPAECPGNCPVQTEVISDQLVPMEYHDVGVIEGSGAMSTDSGSSVAPNRVLPEEASPVVATHTPSPAPTSPEHALPADVEVAIDVLSNLPSADPTELADRPTSGEATTAPSRTKLFSRSADPLSKPRVAAKPIQKPLSAGKFESSKRNSFNDGALDDLVEQAPELEIEKVIPPTRKKKRLTSAGPSAGRMSAAGKLEALKATSSRTSGRSTSGRGRGEEAVEPPLTLESANEPQLVAKSEPLTKTHSFLPVVELPQLLCQDPTSEKVTSSTLAQLPQVSSKLEMEHLPTEEDARKVRIKKQPSNSKPGPIQRSLNPLKIAPADSIQVARPKKAAPESLSMALDVGDDTVIRFVNTKDAKRKPVKLGSLPKGTALRFR